MERIEIAPGLSISRLVTGLWQVADMERDERQLDRQAAVASMEAYVAAGQSSFDMADHYGSAEELAGELVRRRGSAEGLELLTKWVPRPGPVTREGVREAVELSRQRLGVEVIDLLQFHAWSYPDPGYLDCLFYLEELRTEGQIRHLGLTNFDTAHLRVVLASGIQVVTNQVSFSLLDQRARAGMLDLCVEYGVHLLAYGTLAGGFLTERYLGAPEPERDGLETWSQMKYLRFLDQAGGWDALQELLTVLAGVARRHGVSIANVAGRYVLEQPGVAALLVGARLGLSEHIEENSRLFEFELVDESRGEIERALTQLDSIPGDCGDEYRRPPFLTASGDLSHHFDEMPPPYEVREDGGRLKAESGTVWEELAGFSRAVRDGRRILVSGTTSTHGDRLIGGSDPAAQTHFVIDKIQGAIASLGGRLEDVVRTRIYVPGGSDWEAISRAHGARFADIRPANTLIRAELVGEGYLVEIEAEALLPES
jgi:aryl-alcohol dehydrogenase-like predicted oxidoreductase/enamine deaminase RidA (YjgF/YER057c/UK114 family)